MPTSKIIYHYTLKADNLYITVPVGSTILSHDIYHGVIDIWMLCPMRETQMVTRQFVLAPTNEEIVIADDSDATYISTFKVNKEIVHLFEVIEKPKSNQ